MGFLDRFTKDSGVEDSFGLSPDFNSNGIFFAWRRR